MAIRVAITDDHELVRAGLVHFLGSTAEFDVVAEAANGDELLEILRVVQVELLLLDMNMPGRNGADLISHIKRIYPDLSIMVLSMHEETNMVISAIRSGASGYISKNCSPQTLLDAIKKVITTGRYLSSKMSEQLVYATASPNASHVEIALSDRELEILRLIVEGKSVNEIAGELFISSKTVSSHKHNMLLKLNLKGVADLVHYSIERKLFP